MAVDIEDSLKRDLILCANGQRSRFNGIVAVSAPMVKGFVKRYFEADACEDIVQEVFLQIFRSAKRFDERLSAKSWILGIAHHVIVDEIRRRSRRIPQSNGELEDLPSLESGATDL